LVEKGHYESENIKQQQVHKYKEVTLTELGHCHIEKIYVTYIDYNRSKREL